MKKHNIYSDFADDFAILQSIENKEYISVFKLGFPYICKQFKDELLDNTIIVDYGCGAGGFLRYIEHNYNKAKNLIGLDISEVMINKAKSLHIKTSQINYSLIEPFDTRFKDNSIDYVVSTWVTCSISDKNDVASVFKEIFRILKPGGKYIILNDNLPLNREIFYTNIATIEYKIPLKSGDKYLSKIKISADKICNCPNYFWKSENYIELFENIGFIVVSIDTPIATGSGWLEETIYPPYRIITAQKISNGIEKSCEK